MHAWEVLLPPACIDMFPERFARLGGVSAKPSSASTNATHNQARSAGRLAWLTSTHARVGPSLPIDSHGSSPMGLPISAAAMPQLARAMVIAVAAPAKHARSQPLGIRARRTSSTASIAPSTAIQLHCWSRVHASSTQAAAKPVLPITRRTGASQGTVAGAGVEDADSFMPAAQRAGAWARQHSRSRAVE